MLLQPISRTFVINSLSIGGIRTMTDIPTPFPAAAMLAICEKSKYLCSQSKIAKLYPAAFMMRTTLGAATSGYHRAKQCIPLCSPFLDPVHDHSPSFNIFMTGFHSIAPAPKILQEIHHPIGTSGAGGPKSAQAIKSVRVFSRQPRLRR